MTHHIDLSAIHLDKGATADEGPEHGCVMEWTARFAGLKVTDHPPCTSPVLTAFAIAFNDGLPDEDRQRLVPFIPRLVDTAGDAAADSVRAWLATDWLVRRFTPVWLRKAGLDEDAAALEALPELTSSELAKSAQPIIDTARAKASAARAAARAAAWAAARDAAWAAAWAAARDAARDAAWAAAGDAAWDAAKGKKSYSTQYQAAYAASRAILDEALAETTHQLRDEAFALLDRMIDVKVAVSA